MKMIQLGLLHMSFCIYYHLQQICHRSISHPTSLVQSWCTSVGSTSTTMIRVKTVEIYTRWGRIFSNWGEWWGHLIIFLAYLSWISSYFILTYFFLIFLVLHWLWWEIAGDVGLYKVKTAMKFMNMKSVINAFVTSILLGEMSLGESLKYFSTYIL